MSPADFHVRLPARLRIKTSVLADIAFILYFTSSLFATGIAGIVNSQATGEYIVSGIYFFLVLCLYLLSPRQYIKPDFWVLFTLLLAFFGLTALVKPDMVYWYSRDAYGMWDYVFFPTEALYAYLFIRLINDPKRLFRNMKISSWLMYIYFFYQIYAATKRGFWYGVSKTNARAEMSYSVSFGYEVMLYTLPFLYDALLKKNKWDILGAAIGLYMILTQGSRGPFLFLCVFIMLFAINHFRHSRKKIIYSFLAILLLLFLYFFYDILLAWLATLLSSAGISSRIIKTLVEGTVSSDSGRSVIWEAAAQAIVNNPWGHGAMGAQPIIYHLIPAGYPHSVILEILIDYGVFVGSAILIFLFANAFRLLFKEKYAAWRPCFMVFFCTACQLFISLCYWSSPGFWASIAIGVNCYYSNKKQKSIVR